MTHSSNSGPLHGIRVADFTNVMSGPVCTRLLADMGAEIIKIEPPGQPDPLRDWGHARYEGRSLWWPVQSRNKKCVTLNLREQRGQEILHYQHTPTTDTFVRGAIDFIAG